MNLSQPGGCSLDQGFPIKGQRQLKDKWSEGKINTMAHHWPNKYGLGQDLVHCHLRRPALDTCIECLHTKGEGESIGLSPSHISCPIYPKE